MAERLERQADDPFLGHNSSRIELVDVAELKRKRGDPRQYSKVDVDRAKPFVARFCDHMLPILIGASGEILCGAAFVEAARALGIKALRVVRQHGMDEQEQLLFAIGANKILSTGGWDAAAMDEAVRAFERDVEGFGADLLGFAPAELDKLIGSIGGPDGADVLPAMSGGCTSTIGSSWQLGQHRLICGDSTNPELLTCLMDGRRAAAAICDPPFGCKIDGFAAQRGKHRDFVQGAGDMDDDELLAFFRRACAALKTALAPGALVYLFIDWRSLSLLQRAAEEVFGKIVNLVVWSKDRAGMGSFYRSRHELILVLAVPGAKHRNNIELGRHGRDRSNVWDYPSAASSRTGREGDILKLHPTPKAVEMIADAMLDCTTRGEIVVDSFLGSGTSLIAAERTGRICYGAELDPRFVDLAVRRWQRWTGGKAVDAASGVAFDEIEAARAQGEPE